MSEREGARGAQEALECMSEWKDDPPSKRADSSSAEPPLTSLRHSTELDSCNSHLSLRCFSPPREVTSLLFRARRCLSFNRVPHSRLPASPPLSPPCAHQRCFVEMRVSHFSCSTLQTSSRRCLDAARRPFCLAQPRASLRLLPDAPFAFSDLNLARVSTSLLPAEIDTPRWSWFGSRSSAGARATHCSCGHTVPPVIALIASPRQPLKLSTCADSLHFHHAETKHTR